MLSIDYVIIGAGIYGLYSAIQLGKSGKSVLIIETDSEPFSRASFINQARVHNGYHYPRSVSTAVKSARYFKRFSEEFAPAIHSSFRKIYALSSNFSFTNGVQFQRFCGYSGIKCRPIDTSEYFKPGMIDAAFETEEFAFDGKELCRILIEQIQRMKNIEVKYDNRIVAQTITGSEYELTLMNGKIVRASNVFNATYASVNQVLDLFGFEKFKIKYEICEIALCKPNEVLQGVGLTIMDGPFFSVMPFDLKGTFSLTSVTFTPHKTCYDSLPHFDCQNINKDCSPNHFKNCNTCFARPNSAWDYMYQLARKYLTDDIEFYHTKSLFAIKPILLASELDDSRPTVIRKYRDTPGFTSVLSGKINTVYDFSEVVL